MCRNTTFRPTTSWTLMSCRGICSSCCSPALALVLHRVRHHSLRAIMVPGPCFSRSRHLNKRKYDIMESGHMFTIILRELLLIRVVVLDLVCQLIIILGILLLFFIHLLTG